MPRLTALGVSNIIAASASTQLTPALAASVLRDGASMLSFAASGGARSEHLVEEIDEAIRAIARRAEYPDNPSQVARAKFDHDASAYFGSHPQLASGEALRDDVWSYLATAVLPDVVSWRFPDRAEHRFKGGVRNALQRLWMRGRVLDRGEDHPERWGLVRALSEDAAVQIFERASIAGSKALASAIAEEWLLRARSTGRARMEPIMRRAMKLVRLRNEIVDVDGLPEEARSSLVASCFQLAEESLQDASSSD